MRIRTFFFIGTVLLLSCSRTTPSVTVVGSAPEVSAQYAVYLSDVTLEDSQDPVAIIETEKGMIAFEVYEALVPQTAQNFESLVADGFYNGLRFHIVEPGFAIQTGDPTGIGTGGADVPGVSLEAHPDLSHDHAGIVGMARDADDVNSATSQFYVLLGPDTSLDGKYAIFGSVVKGLDVAQQIVRGDKITRIVLVRLTTQAS